MKYLFVLCAFAHGLLCAQPPKNNFISGKYPLLGKAHESVPFESHALKGAVFYLISGHGGPDPGAMATHNGSTICEDEYAYDITLRLAQKLIANGAKVYMITRDEKNGIRDQAILPPDQGETCYKKGKIPLNQLKRLEQRVEIINQLAQKHKASYQRVVEIHIDSRAEDAQTDLYFYHLQNSEKGARLALNLHSTLAQKYAEHQKNRGYRGTIEARKLYSLKATTPYAVYIEVGNIQNAFDLKRILLHDNRQAIANWLGEGLVSDFKMGE